jgi:protein-disulfide isomerase
MGKKAAQENRTARAAEVLESQRRAESRRRLTMVTAVVAAIVVVVGVGWLVSSTLDSSGEAAPSPSGMEGYAVPVGDADAPTTLAFYEDPQCPICQQFEAEIGEEVAAAVEAGEVKVDYHVVSFLDEASENAWSSRAANALMVVQDLAGPDAFVAMHDLLYDNQPAEGTAGPSDAQLVAWAVEAGAPEAAAREGIESGRFDQFVVNATDQMSKDGVNGTPTVFVDGEKVEGTPADAVTAVREALGTSGS